MASIRKRKWTYKGVEKEAWILTYADRAGKRRQETFDKKKEADQRRTVVEEELRKGIHVAGSQSGTVGEACDAFMRQCDRRLLIKDRMTRGTLNAYDGSCRIIKDRLGAKKLSDLMPEHVEGFLSELCLTYKRKTVQRHQSTFKLVLSLAFRNGKVGRNVMVDGGVRMPEMKKTRIAIPSRAEVMSLLNALKARAHMERESCLWNRRVVVFLATFCGMRRGEIAGLDWEMVDFAQSVIRIRQSFSSTDGIKEPKTEAGIRTVPMPAIVAWALKGLQKCRDDVEAGPVIVSRTARRMTPHQIYDWLWVPVAKRAGLADDEGKPRYRLHALRHVTVSLMIAEGLSPLHIKTFIGHADVSTTMDVYGHLFHEDNGITKGIHSIAGQFSMQQESGKAPQLVEYQAQN